MKRTGNKPLIFGLLAGLFMSAGVYPANADDVTITIVHTNDIHGHLFAGRDDLSPGEPRPILGGARALARFVGSMREQRRESGGVLLVDSGDLYHGTPEGDFTRGKALTDFLELLGYDAAVVGNHEFAYGVRSFQRLVEGSRFPWVGTNIKISGPGLDPDLLTKLVLKRVGGVSFAILGVTTHRCKLLNLPKHTMGFEFQNVFSTIPPMVAKLEKAGHVVIVLSHIGSEADKQLATLIPGSSVILGGHDHIVVSQADRSDSPLVAQTGEYLRRVGRCDVIVRLPSKDPDDESAAGPRVISVNSRVINLTPVTGKPLFDEEKATAKFLQEQRFQSFDVFVAKASAPFPRGRGTSGPTRLGTFVAEALRHVSGAETAFLGYGGIRGGLGAGPVSLRDLYLVYPFEDPIHVLTLNGKDFIKAFRNQLRGGRLSLATSNLRLSYDVTEKLSKRLSEVYVGDRKVEPGGKYTVAVTEFMLQRLLTTRKLKPLAVKAVGSTVFRALLEYIDVEPDSSAASGGLLGAVRAERGGRLLMPIPEPSLSGSRVLSPAKLWLTHKINLNTASVELLESLPWITAKLARAIIEERDTEGDFESIADLQDIPGITKNDLKKFERFLKIE